MASLQSSTYTQNTLIQSASPNVLRPPIVSSANTGLTNTNNLVYITNTSAGSRLGDAIQIYFSGGAGFVKYVTYGP
jgi:hypothetical protein